MITADDVEQLMGAEVLDRTEARIGEVRQVFLDAETEAPTWLGVRVGLLGAEVLVPLDGADWDLGSLRAAVSQTSARSAPAVDVDEPLTTTAQERLLRHYGIPCVLHPREQVDLDTYDDAEVRYSVDDRQQDSTDAPLLEQRDIGQAMEEAEHERVESVSGHMTAAAPEPLERRTT